MRPLADASSRWLETLKHSSSLDDLRRAVKGDGPDSPCIAGLQAFLLNQTTHTANWTHALLESRSSYASLREHFLKYTKHPEYLTAGNSDPLADDANSPWNTYRQDETMRAEILQDVQRLPDEPFYHQPHIQILITDVLFIYCKLNPDVGGYRQGMHELLAPIVYVVEQDAIDPADVCSGASGDLRMVEMLDASFVEHDSFALFSRVMDFAKAFYETSELSDNTGDAAFSMQSTKSSIVEKILEADYSVALQLLLKYPIPQRPNGPHTFIDDAVYLQDHLNTAGGAELIAKYTGRAPRPPNIARPTTPKATAPGLRQKLAGARSPLSPPRFRPPPGGVEALFQGAAKNVLEQSERLGINQAVRDAMLEIRRNVQEAKSSMKTSRDLFSEPRPSTAIRAVAFMDRRNRQLASMLDEPIAALRNLSTTSELSEDKQKAQDALEVAVAKLQFIKVYLEDSTLALPDEEDAQDSPASPKPAERKVDSEPLSDAVAAMALNTPMLIDPPNIAGSETSKPTSSALERDSSRPDSSTAENMDTDPLGVETTSTVQTLQRPQPPIPTRSTLAQSSFSWMLEPHALSQGSTSGSMFRSASTSKSDTMHRKKPSANASRERTAFLFGEVPSDADGNAIREEDIFGLEPIQKGTR
ncbi:hypothetical protein E0Z10_g4218 [Xylaria hypoxylon]|uniref:Rab-GAP TBC domain-containing protein n=1 Tax=Xylaria hypoxylon TaxID=37992 RepID=A0A4Z0YJQ6_9PEZI|nr:hypothetical protein E0Z10_g4218 [Xylaria hypoxylon]